MTLTLRRGREGDAAVAGEICYRAFKTLADEHGFPPDFASVEQAVGVLAGMIGHEGFFDTMAEIDGRGRLAPRTSQFGALYPPTVKADRSCWPACASRPARLAIF